MSRGHGDKLERMTEIAIAALLSNPSVEQAAKSIDVDPGTLQSWLRLDEFQEQYREVRRQLLDHTVTRMQTGLSKAIDVLERNLSCGTPSVEVRTALGWLSHTLKIIEVCDLQERILELEKQLGDNK